MAYGTLKADVIQSDTTNVPPQFNGGNGVQVGTLCRAWVNFNGTGTVAIRSSFNVSSITDNGTGDYTVNFTNALPDANYALVGTTSVFSAGAGAATVVELYDTAGGGTNPTTTTARIYTHRSAVAAVDQTYVYVSVFR